MPLLRVGHRGAAALAPENTLRSFEAALARGVDAIEFDVLDLADGPLVLAHSNDLAEVSHGAAAGTVRERSLDELREVAPELPTLDEALEFLAAHDVGLHVDLKLTTRLDEVADGLVRHGLAERSVVSSFHLASLAAFADAVLRESRSASRIPRTGTASRGGGRSSRRSGSARWRCAALVVARIPAHDRARRGGRPDAPSRRRVRCGRRTRARGRRGGLGLDGRRSSGARATRCGRCRRSDLE